MEIGRDETPREAAPEKEWPVWARGFLAHFALTGNITASAAAVDIDRGTATRLRERDKSFDAACKEAHAQSSDYLEMEARRRAVDGWEEPVYGSGGPGKGTEQVGVVRKYSDTLLIFLTKGALPEKYRERFDQKVSGSLDIGTAVAAAHAAVLGGASE